MLTRFAGLLGLIVLAWVAAPLLSASMLYLPGTPLRRSIEHVQVLAKYRDAPDSPGAGAAFDLFIELGRQVTWFESTVISMAVGVVVALLARWRAPLGGVEFTVVVLAFAVGRIVLGRVSVADPALLASVVCFGVFLAAGEMLRRALAPRVAA